MNKKGNVWIVLGVLLFIVLAIGIFFVGIYNSLITSNEDVDNAWSKVETQYQRRIDLIPNLVNTIKGATKYEGTTLEEITRLRSQWQTAPNVNAKVDTANQIESAISKLLVITENYPELKATDQFIGLKDELTNTENKVAVERSRFNDAVTIYNKKLKTFPNNLVGSILGFSQREYFKSAEGAQNAPNVSFT